MNSSAWDNIISAEEERLYRRAGFSRRGGLGSRPAVLVVDVQCRSVGPRGMTLEDAMEVYSTACGPVGWQAIDAIAELLSSARSVGVPVFHAFLHPHRSTDVGALAAKIPATVGGSEEGHRIVDELAPLPDEALVPRSYPSAFFGTPLVSHLVAAGADSVLVCGSTTSGCVRATVVDACSYNYSVGVVHECVYDRGPTSHAVNLFDMDSKYADVISLTEAIEYLSRGSRQDALTGGRSDGE